MTEKSESLKVINSKDVPGIFTAYLLDHGIIEIEWDLDFKQVDEKHLVQVRDAIIELGNGNKMRVYISTNELMDITPEARRYAVSDKGQVYTLANAVLTDHIAKKILFNFFLNVSKPKVPTKGFGTREEALEWLLHFR